MVMADNDRELLELADKHGKRWGAPDEMGYSFELSAFKDFCNALQTAAYAEGRSDEAMENNIAGSLIDAWVAAHGRPIPWAKAVEITAIVNKLPDEERVRLLSLDDMKEG